MTNRNKEIYNQRSCIQDIVGPAKLWPLFIRCLFWTKNLKHFERILIATFVYINGLNPTIFMQWVKTMHLARDNAAQNHFSALFR